MAKKKQTDKLENVEQVINRSEQFVEKNQKAIIILIVLIVVIVLGIFGYRKYISEPKANEAAGAIFQAERYFEQDSMHLALYGDGNNFGFLTVIDEYGSTPSGKLAKYYAGIAYLNIGEYDNAINYLESFSTSNKLFNALAKCATGDAYMQKGDIETGIKFYTKAAKTNPDDTFNTPIYLMKLGMAYETSGQYSKALEEYKKIKFNYPKSREFRDIDKYISRVEYLLSR